MFFKGFSFTLVSTAPAIKVTKVCNAIAIDELHESPLWSLSLSLSLGSPNEEPKKEIEKEAEEAAVSTGVQTGIWGQRWGHQVHMTSLYSDVILPVNL